MVYVMEVVLVLVVMAVVVLVIFVKVVNMSQPRTQALVC